MRPIAPLKAAPRYACVNEGLLGGPAPTPSLGGALLTAPPRRASARPPLAPATRSLLAGSGWRRLATSTAALASLGALWTRGGAALTRDGGGVSCRATRAAARRIGAPRSPRAAARRPRLDSTARGATPPSWSACTLVAQRRRLRADEGRAGESRGGRGRGSSVGHARTGGIVERARDVRALGEEVGRLLGARRRPRDLHHLLVVEDVVDSVGGEDDKLVGRDDRRRA